VDEARVEITGLGARAGKTLSGQKVRMESRICVVIQIEMGTPNGPLLSLIVHLCFTPPAARGQRHGMRGVAEGPVNPPYSLRLSLVGALDPVVLLGAPLFHQFLNFLLCFESP